MGPYYTYTIFADDVPVYVGKGQSQRCLEHLRTKRELRGRQITIQVEWASSEDAALARERELIAQLAPGRTLLNIASNPELKAKLGPILPATRGKAVKWGPKGRRKFGHTSVSVTEVASDLLDEAETLLLHPSLGSPYWFQDADRWLADHAYYEDQFEDWHDGPPTGFAKVMAARRRFERVLDHARAWCKDVSNEEFSFRFSMLVGEHPWLDAWLGSF